MDQENAVFARQWARRYARIRRLYGLDEGDVKNRILESLYYNKYKEKALSKALNSIQNESRRNMRALWPWQVRNAAPHLALRAQFDLATDMRRLRCRQSVREDDRRHVRLVLGMMSQDDQCVAHDFLELCSWGKVAARRGMSEGTFRRRVLAGFALRFKEAWQKIF